MKNPIGAEGQLHYATHGSYAMEEYQLRVPDELDELPEDESAVHGYTPTDPKAGKGKPTIDVSTLSVEMDTVDNNNIDPNV